MTDASDTVGALIPVFHHFWRSNSLAKLIPAADEVVYEFGRFVSPYLNSQLIPLGFVRLCEAAIYDLNMR